MTVFRSAFFVTIFAAFGIVAPLSVAFAANDEDPYAYAMVYAQEKGWMQGYSDGSLRPEKPLTRVEFLKVLLLASGHEIDAKKCKLRRLPDVPQNQWFSGYVCAALRLKIINQPSDGLLHPAQKITLAEAAKMLSVAMDSVEPAKSDPWYKPYVSHLAETHIVPPTIVSYKSHVTRGELAEMLRRLKEHESSLVYVDADTLLNGKCTWFVEPEIPGVDLDSVKQTWLGWYNDVRGY